MPIRVFFFFLFCLWNCSGYCQVKNSKPLHVLFIGNSYIYFNILPEMLKSAAEAAGEKLIVDSSTPGGYTFRQHTKNAVTLEKIRQGNWDYVILQEQSIAPSAPDVEKNVYPYAHSLDSLIHKSSPQAKVIFYMTWGRKNGDATRCKTWPPVCSYQGMDSILRVSYKEMAKRNKAMLCPVSDVWKYLRAKYPSIELYQADGSHPSPAGSFAAACALYKVIYKKDPAGLKFDCNLSPGDAAIIRKAVSATLAALNKK